MIRSLRIACFLISAASAAATAGCFVGETPLLLFEGTEKSVLLEYRPTQSVRIVSATGEVEVTTGDVDGVEVTFSPFTEHRDGQGYAAREEMEENLALDAVVDGDILVTVQKFKDEWGYNPDLGAHVRVVLPARFDGALRVDQGDGGVHVDLDGARSSRAVVVESDSGSIDVVGAGGPVDLITGDGDISAAIEGWSDVDGLIRSGNGSIKLAMPAQVDGTMTAQTKLGEVVEQDLPSAWVVAGEGSARSYTMGAGEGGWLEVVTALGDIAIVVK
ncbi:hypothetical protein SOCE26_005460 [Sorangium cellulosum]|uniref:Adhesin domain-containing protein n=1 Tax=Sorangium cellulosum TaxID=56 RepID=A0A2L0EIS1_SORCE|nr:hypothetical protein [Sorangium cellulosum]AUX39164.1 hypothetical protein SOCE26_005460 [Sorangium cellulosum]